MSTTDELLDIFMKDYKKPEDLIGENGLLKQLTKRLLVGQYLLKEWNYRDCPHHSA